MENNILNKIKDGMEVFDRDGAKVGTVEFVHFGASSELDEELGTVPATTDEYETTGDEYVAFIKKVFGAGEEFPETVKNRLLQEGFIRVDSDNLFGEDRYVMDDKIASVAGDRVNLIVDEDDLITR